MTNRQIERIRNIPPQFTAEQLDAAQKIESELDHLIQYPTSQEEAMSQLNATKESSNTQ